MMSKDDMETECMNELFGKSVTRIAQVYVKRDEENDFTSIVVASNGNCYFRDVLDVPEITGIQRGVSFVKHDLDADFTEIYPDKMDINEVLQDAYIRYCKVHPIAGKSPNKEMKELCGYELQRHKYLRGINYLKYRGR